MKPDNHSETQVQRNEFNYLLVDGAEQRLLTVHEVAKSLRVPVSWVYDHVREGCSDPLPVIRLGKYLRFSQNDILAYLKRLRNRSIV